MTAAATSKTTTPRGQHQQPSRPPLQQQPPQPSSAPAALPVDEHLPAGIHDPRNPHQKIHAKKKKGRNTESFDPSSTLVRPDVRVRVGSSQVAHYPHPLKHDDVVIVPELFGAEDDWKLYYQLLNEMSDLQQQQSQNKKKQQCEWTSWHEGAHLIVKNPRDSPTFQSVLDKLCDYFSIERKSMGFRFNWYKDSSDWKPFHHDSAAFNPQRAKTQNITVGVSFGATRELAFLHASATNKDDKIRLYFPQTNNGVFTFGRDVNIHWKHGINALAPEEQDGKGRISIIVWGLAQNVVEEAGSPPLLGANGKGPHANNNNNKSHNRRNRNSNKGKKGDKSGDAGKKENRKEN